jgi:hypothetical protein
MNPSGEYPKYLVRVNNVPKFLPLREVQLLYDWPRAEVKIELFVLEAGDGVRDLTAEDRELIEQGERTYRSTR